MKGKKTYLQPAEMVLNAIHDVSALQKGQITLCDTPNGLVCCHVTMYGETLEYRFIVIDIGSGCSRVIIELTAEAADERLVNNEFALLDYALLGKARIDFMEREEWDRRLRDGKPEG